MALKMKIRNKVLVLMAAVTLLVAAGVPDNTPQAAYIRKYAEVAVREMYRSGVPASITLAQGLLESGAGNHHWPRRATTISESSVMTGPARRCTMTMTGAENVSVSMARPMKVS